MIFCVILLLFYCLELFLFLPTFRFFVLKDAILFFHWSSNLLEKNENWFDKFFVILSNSW